MTTMPNVSNYADALNRAVATELVAYRAAARMTQAQVYKAAGISKSTMIRIEAGSVDIGTKDIAAITDVYNVEPQELMQRAQARVEKERSADTGA